MVRQVPLTQGEVALVDDDDYPLAAPYKWHRATHGYAARWEPDAVEGWSRKRQVDMHHHIMGTIPGQVIWDHVNGNKADSRRCNLRRVTYSQNMINRRRCGRTSRYRGVDWCSRLGKWRARIRTDRRLVHLGYLDSEVDAARLYDEGAILYHREFARVNFPQLPMF
jgi:hypothetical protein